MNFSLQLETGPFSKHEKLYFCLQKRTAGKPAVLYVANLLFNDLQQVHGTGFDADAAGDALGCRAVRLHDHNLHGASFHTLTAADTKLLVDHVHTGLRILGDGTIFTGLHALTALDAGHRLCAGTFGNHLDAAQVRMKLFVERVGASTNALQASHTLYTFFRH